jgi:hypothetical protein
MSAPSLLFMGSRVSYHYDIVLNLIKRYLPARISLGREHRLVSAFCVYVRAAEAAHRHQMGGL